MRRAIFLFLLVSLSCRTAPAPVERKVLMLSLDGADAASFHRFYREGKLNAGGFARFVREGQVADALIPVNPSITAPNHISLATGYPTSKTGIVANDIRLPGMPLSKRVSGFSAEIHTETLWEAAKRQGLKVASSGWPGADARNPRRTPHWGMTYTGSAEQEPELRTVRNWKGPLKEGEWALVPCRTGETRPGCWVKVLEVLESDPPSMRVFFGGEYKLRGYPEAYDQAMHEAGLVWSGPPSEHLLTETWAGREGIDLDTWVEQAEIFSTFFMDALLAASRHGDWDLLMAYTPVIDEAGHQLMLADPRQPGYSPERAATLEAGRLRLWQSVDRELSRLLDAVDLRTTTVLIVSDHGMTPTHTAIDVDNLLREWGLLALEADGITPTADSRADSISAGGICHVHLRTGASLEKVREDLMSWSERNGRPIIRILTRAEAAEIQMDHPNSGDLILIAEPGFYFRHEGDPVLDTPLSPSTTYLGTHGYLNSHPAVHGIYLALGAGIKKGSAGTVRNTDVAGRVAAWLGIEKPREKP